MTYKELRHEADKDLAVAQDRIARARARLAAADAKYRERLGGPGRPHPVAP